MANITDIATAQGYGFLMKQMFGVEPDYDYQGDYVRVYYSKDKLPGVQRNIEGMSAEKPGSIRVDWFPMVAPLAAKKAIPIAVGLVAVGFILGKL
jgi:hypothetical protein